MAKKSPTTIKAHADGVAKAIQHLKNAVKALERIPAHDFMGDIPNAIANIEEIISTDNGEAGLEKLLQHYRTEAAQLSESSNMDGQPTTSQQFSDGDIVIYDDGIHVVVLSDPKADMVGIIPAGMANASAEEKNRSVEMVKPDKLRKPTEEEMSVMRQSPEQRSHIDDDMAARFSMEGVEQIEKALREVWDMKKATSGGKKYKKEFLKNHKEESDVKKRNERRAENSVNESTWNYVGSDLSHKETESDPVNVVGQGDKQWTNSLDPKMVKSEIPTQLDNRGEQSMDDYETKIKFPSKLANALQEAINEFRRAADRQGTGHTAQENKQLYNDTADAYEKLLGFLKEGSLQGLKQAQIFAQTLMGPMLHKLPAGVWDYLTNGGQKRSLSDYMTKIKTDK